MLIILLMPIIFMKDIFLCLKMILNEFCFIDHQSYVVFVNYNTLINTINLCNPLYVLTPVNVALQMRSHAMSSIIELQMQSKSQQCQVLFYQLCDFHLDLITQYLRPLKDNVNIKISWSLFFLQDLRHNFT